MTDSRQEHENTQHDLWNKREKKSPLLLYLLLTLLCLVLAYLLSGTTR